MIKSKKLIALVCAVACLIFAIGCWNMLHFSNKQDVNSFDYQLNLGFKYLSDEKYEDAILTFSYAIEIDPKRPEAYSALADVYTAVNNTDAALDTLRQGFRTTGDTDIRERILAAFPAEDPAELIPQYQIYVGESMTFPVSATVPPKKQKMLFFTVEDTSVLTIGYSSENESVVQVGNDGKMYGVGPGETNVLITATRDNESASSIAHIVCIKKMDATDLDLLPSQIVDGIGFQTDLVAPFGDYFEWDAVVETTNPDIVSVEQTTLKAMSPGQCTVMVTVGNKSKTIDFQIEQQLEDFVLSDSALSGNTGASFELKIDSYLPETANIGLDFVCTSSDENIVSVQSGEDDHIWKLALTNAGAAVVTVSNGSGLQKECKITVAVPPPVYDLSNPDVAVAMSMVGEIRKCVEPPEAVANNHGLTGWAYGYFDDNNIFMPFDGESVENGNETIWFALTPENFIRLGEIIPYSEIQPGDILYYTDGGWGISHVAVYIGSGMAVHGNFTTQGETKIARANYRTPTYVIHLP